MGDLITLEPLLRQITSAGFDAVLASPQRWRGLFPQEEVRTWIDAEVPWVSYASKEKYKPGNLFNWRMFDTLVRLRRASKGTPGFDPRGDIRSVIVLHLAGCRPVYSLDCYRGSDIHILPVACRLIPFSHAMRHWEINLALAQRLGVAAKKSGGPRFEHFGNAAKPSRIIGLVTSAPWKGRYWEEKKWKAVVAALEKEGWQVEAYCGPGQEADTKAQLGDSVPVRVNATIQSWAESLLRARCVITLDTGPMHLADALGVPVVALFGPGKLPLWAPSHPQSVTVHHQDDPDFQVIHQIDANVALGRKSMERITVDEVLAAAHKIIGSSSR